MSSWAMVLAMGWNRLPLAIGALDIDIEEDVAAPVGVEQGAPRAEGDADLPGLAEDVDRAPTVRADRDEIRTSVLENPEIQRGDVGGYDGPGVVRAYVGLAADFGVLLDGLGRAGGQP